MVVLGGFTHVCVMFGFHRQLALLVVCKDVSSLNFCFYFKGMQLTKDIFLTCPITGAMLLGWTDTGGVGNWSRRFRHVILDTSDVFKMSCFKIRIELCHGFSKLFVLGVDQLFCHFWHCFTPFGRSRRLGPMCGSECIKESITVLDLSKKWPIRICLTKFPAP